MRKQTVTSIFLALLALCLFLWPSYISAMVYRDCETIDGCTSCWPTKQVEFYPLACFFQYPCRTWDAVEESNARMEIIACLCNKEPRDNQTILNVFAGSFAYEHYKLYGDPDALTPEELCTNADFFTLNYIKNQ